MAIPLMLITLGVAVARLSPGRFWRARVAVAWSRPRSASPSPGPWAAGFGAAADVAFAVLVLQVATPVAVTSLPAGREIRRRRRRRGRASSWSRRCSRSRAAADAGHRDVSRPGHLISHGARFRYTARQKRTRQNEREADEQTSPRRHSGPVRGAVAAAAVFGTPRPRQRLQHRRRAAEISAARCNGPSGAGASRCAVQMATIHQESKFIGNARTPHALRAGDHPDGPAMLGLRLQPGAGRHLGGIQARGRPPARAARQHRATRPISWAGT